MTTTARSPQLEIASLSSTEMSDNTPAATDSTTPATGHGHHQHQHHHHHHGHGHGHGHGHAHEGDLASANKHHYDSTVDDYEAQPRVKDRAKRVVAAIRETVNLSKESTSVLEFACGPGVVCREILPYVKEIVGIDISTGAVERCNQRFKEEGVNETCFAIAANIMTEKNVLSGRKFDLVYCASAYHHFENPEEITRLLKNFLKPDGTLIIIDNYAKGGEEEEIDDERRKYVTRFGFNEEDMKQLFAAADLEFVSFAEIKRGEGDNDVFIAKATLKSN
ncbi:hypothetical protein NMY22_g14758 [Coprinellus aureogranulatus]|nr:hypothetical protein NMY22_g14758 [Coprinellus aureogranulatus]